MIEFQEFDKIPRLFRDITVTEKIDGTNGAVGIKLATLADIEDQWDFDHDNAVFVDNSEWESWEGYLVYAQSRSRLITPKIDNHGFARWVWENAASLVANLGVGLHFGEWWGSGIQRGYGLPKGEKRFSLFNTKRWSNSEFTTRGLYVVPVLYQGMNSTIVVRVCLNKLDEFGSVASPGFKPAEGVAVFHSAGNNMFKATILNDEVPKSQVATIGTISEATYGFAGPIPEDVLVAA